MAWGSPGEGGGGSFGKGGHTGETPGTSGDDASLSGGEAGYYGSYAQDLDSDLGELGFQGGLRSGERDREGMEGQGDLGGEGHDEYSSDSDSGRTQYAGLSEEDINALIDKRIEEGGYKSTSERQQAGLDAGRAGIERFKVAYDNINAQFGAHWKEVYGKNMLGTEARAKDLGVEYKSEGALSEKIKKTVESSVEEAKDA